MLTFSRLSRSKFANWWWTVDKVTLSLVLILIFIGAFLVFSASPSVARRIGFTDYHFIKRQLVFIFISLAIIFALSIQRLKTIRRIAIIGYVLTLLLMVLTLLVGYETKGASRWIRLFGFSLQPSEFIKPTFIVVSAWLLDGGKKFEDFPGGLLSAGLYVLSVGMLLQQPDVGMTIVVSCIWGFQLFLAGLPVALMAGLGLLAVAGAVVAYFTFSHVHDRVHQFLASGNELGYQVRKSLEAFQSGNLLGRGPGEEIGRAHV